MKVRTKTMSDIKNQDENLTDHDYDGIQELDNPLPLWWLITFLGSIFFSFIYYIHFQFGFGPSLDQELEASLNQVKSMQVAHGGGSIDVDQLNSLIGDEEALSKGAELYDARCAVCHGVNLQGSIGPNLTDNYWIHGKGDPESLVTVVKDGVLDKGMPAWDSILTEDEMGKIAVYIISKIGSEPEQAKAPEGALVE